MTHDDRTPPRAVPADDGAGRSAGAAVAVLDDEGTVIGWTLGASGLLGARYTARSPRRTGATAAALVVGVTLLATLVTGLAAVSPAIEASRSQVPTTLVLSGRASRSQAVPACTPADSTAEAMVKVRARTPARRTRMPRVAVTATTSTTPGSSPTR